ncbi:MAG: beta-propeller fold lactonase family protein, partial [Clostridia bacterium]|nr:beta-propeller fold lactonase family protein [Clostridia bacterium]
GSLKDPSDILPTGGIGSCHLDINEHGIYTANYYSGSVSRISGTDIRTVTHTGHSTDIFRQSHPYAHFVKVLNDTNVVVCDLGCDEVVLYDKELNRLSAAKLPSGTGPRHLVTAKNDGEIWVLSEMGSTLTKLTYDGRSLTVGDTVDLYPDRMREVVQTKSAAIRISSDETTVYTSNRGFDVISIVDISLGHARLCGEVSSYGGSPRDFNISPDGRYMIVTNEATGIALMSLEGKIPRITNVYPLEAPLCVSFNK